jgi:seryl-tRNA(Sec) selenium transferase
VRSRSGSAAALEAALRAGQPAIVARVQGGRVLLDARTLLEEPLATVADAVAAAIERTAAAAIERTAGAATPGNAGGKR